MPRLVRLYLHSIAAGLALAVMFTALLIGLDVAHLRHLVTHGGGAGVLAVIMLIAFNTIVFSGVQFGIAVMRLAESPPPRGGKRQRRTLLSAAAPILVTVDASRD